MPRMIASYKELCASVKDATLDGSACQVTAYRNQKAAKMKADAERLIASNAMPQMKLKDAY